VADQVYHLAQGNQKTIEKVIRDENIHYMHMIFNKGEALPEHPANSNVYMTVLRGTLSLVLNDRETGEYAAGTVIKIPFGTKMNVRNLHEETLEITVVKAPAPKN
jgi:quercetin dioxygenase-like cupin family protein